MSAKLPQCKHEADIAQGIASKDNKHGPITRLCLVPSNRCVDSAYNDNKDGAHLYSQQQCSEEKDDAKEQEEECGGQQFLHARMLTQIKLPSNLQVVMRLSSDAGCVLARPELPIGNSQAHSFRHYLCGRWSCLWVARPYRLGSSENPASVRRR